MTDAPETVRDAEPTQPAIPLAVYERHPMPKEVAEAIAAVMGELTKLEYTQTNTYSNYRYAGVDDFYEAIRPLMAKAGLVIVPEEISTSSLSTETSNGKRSWLVIKYDFTLNVGGVEWGFRPKRTAMADASMGSQAFGAAASYAEKFFLRALFKVATGEPDIDGAAEGAGESLPALTSRQAQGMGQDNNQFKRGAENQQRRQEGQTQQRQTSNAGTKTAAQAKRDGDWNALVDGMAIQRSEEELVAWGVGHENDLKRLPREWKVQARELYVKELARVRRNDEDRATRQADGMDPNKGFDDQTDEGGWDAATNDALNGPEEDDTFPGDRPPV